MEMVKISKIDMLFKINIIAFDIASRILSGISLPRYINKRKLRLNNKELKNKKKFDKCYIIGLGPSLKDINLNGLDGDSIVVNHFYKFGKDIKFRPTYYLAVDNSFASSEHIDSIYEAIDLYKYSTTFILSEKITKEIKNLDFSGIYSVFGGGQLFNSNSKIDFTKRYPIGFNVLADAIMLAIYLGYKEIVLLGADFNSFASQKALHVYEEEDDRKIELWKELFCYSIVAHVHKELNNYGKKNNITIINATKGSLIDSYDRDEEYLEKTDNIQKFKGK